MNKEIFRVACVVVAYNNGDNIVKLVESLLTQSERLGEIIVVDNASSDDTAKVVKDKFPQVTLLANASNTGVGGGYAQGMEYAHQKGYEWVWLLDGDSLPQATALEELEKAFATLRETHPRIGILASCPTNPLTGLRCDGFLRRDLFKTLVREIPFCEDLHPVDAVISSGSLISREVIREVGLTRVDFFMDYVDTEYSLRVRRKGYEIYCVPASVIHHDMGTVPPSLSWFGRIVTRFIKRRDTRRIHPPWRYYYIMRNELYTFWHEFRDYKAVFYFVLFALLKLANMYLYKDDRKAQKIKYTLLGIRDGLRGKLGKTVSPE
jgi:GT2 family glycosyltransferase